MTGLPELDPVIHAQARLRVTASLAALGDGGSITFPRLQELLDMTAGNLSTHLRKLEDASYIELTKTHERRIPVTYVLLTRTGRRAFEDYTTSLRALLDGAEPAAGPGPSRIGRYPTPPPCVPSPTTTSPSSPILTTRARQGC